MLSNLFCNSFIQNKLSLHIDESQEFDVPFPIMLDFQEIEKFKEHCSFIVTLILRICKIVIDYLVTIQLFSWGIAWKGCRFYQLETCVENMFNISSLKVHNFLWIVIVTTQIMCSFVKWHCETFLSRFIGNINFCLFFL